MGTQRVNFDLIRKFSQDSTFIYFFLSKLHKKSFFLAGLDLRLLMVPVKLRVLGQVSEIHGAFLRDDGVDDRFVCGLNWNLSLPYTPRA